MYLIFNFFLLVAILSIFVDAVPPSLNGFFYYDYGSGLASSRISPLYQPDHISYSSSGMKISITGMDDAPTLGSDFSIFYGSVQVLVQAAPGRGIVSAVVLLSDDGDEIDLEWIGGDPSHGKCNTFSNPPAEF